MRRRVKKSALLFVGVGVMAAVVTPVVIAATGDTDDHISPASTVVKAALKTGTKTTFTGTVGGIAVTQHCTGSSTSGKTPATGLGPFTTSPPTFTGCTDSLGGTDTVKTNATNGAWKITFLDKASEVETAAEGTGSTSGDKIRITIPIKGATLTSSAAPTCTITVAPTAKANVTGAYNDINTLTITNAPVPAATSAGCPGGAGTTTGHFSATYVLTPKMHDVS
jgi:hypothetical protein